MGLLQGSVKENGTAHVAHTVFVPYQRQAYATEWLAGLLTHLFDDYHVAGCVAEVDTRNAASITLLERLRFARTGTTVGADVFKGASSDEYRYELTSTGVAGVGGQESEGCSSHRRDQGHRSSRATRQRPGPSAWSPAAPRRRGSRRAVPIGGR